jgi:hypothetical protein
MAQLAGARGGRREERNGVPANWLASGRGCPRDGWLGTHGPREVMTMETSPGYTHRPLTGPPPQIRFSALGDAWNLLTSNMGTWIGAALIYALIAIALFGGGMFWMIGDALIRGRITQGWQPPLGAVIGMLVLSAALQAWLTGGMIRLAIRQVRGQPTGVGDMFGAASVFPNLFGLYLLLGAAGTIAGQVPGIQFFSYLVQAVITGPVLFAAPLIVDQRMGLGEAIRTSWETVRPQLGMAILFSLVTTILGMAGALACGVGMLFTLPWTLLAVIVLYRDYFITSVPETGLVIDLPAPPPSTTAPPTAGEPPAAP